MSDRQEWIFALASRVGSRIVFASCELCSISGNWNRCPFAHFHLSLKDAVSRLDSSKHSRKDKKPSSYLVRVNLWQLAESKQISANDLINISSEEKQQSYWDGHQDAEKAIKSLHYVQQSETRDFDMLEGKWLLA